MIVFIYKNQHFYKICQDRLNRIIQLQNCFVNYVINIFISVKYPTVYVSCEKKIRYEIYLTHNDFTLFIYTPFFFTGLENYKRMERLVHVPNKCCQCFCDDDQFSDKKNVLNYSSFQYLVCVSTSLINTSVKRSGFFMFH